MLTWAMIGDSLTLVVAVIPLAAVCAIRLYRGLVVRGTALAAQWFEVSLIVAGLVAAGLSTLVLRVIGHLGGFVLLAPVQGLVKAAHVGLHLRLAAEGVLALFGADVFGHPQGRRPSSSGSTYSASAWWPGRCAAPCGASSAAMTCWSRSWWSPSSSTWPRT